MSDRIAFSDDQAADLLALRENKGISQYELADRADMTRSKIKRIEKGEVQTISQQDYDTLVEILRSPSRRSKKKVQKTPKPVKAKTHTRKGANGTAGSGRKDRRGGPMPRDARVDAEVKRQVRASVLTVIRDVIGDSGRVLVEKHELHNVTLGELYQVD